jgi:hypothetical protein
VKEGSLVAEPSDLMPRPWKAGSLRTRPFLVVMGLAFLCVVLAAGAIAWMMDDPELTSVLFYLLQYGFLGSAAVAFVVLTGYDRARERSRQRELREVGRALKLRFRERVHWDELGPYRSFVLFRIGAEDYNAAGDSFRGQSGGLDVWLFEAQYRCVFPDRGGRYRGQWASQTVVILPGVGQLPAFHLTPAQCPWEEVMPAWHMMLDVGNLVLNLDGQPEPSRVYSNDTRAVKRLFRTGRLAFLGDLSGWAIESHKGHLLLYRPGEIVPPRHLPAFLGRAIDLAQGLLRDSKDMPAGDEPEPSTNVRRLPPGYRGET